MGAERPLSLFQDNIKDNIDCCMLNESKGHRNQLCLSLKRSKVRQSDRCFWLWATRSKGRHLVSGLAGGQVTGDAKLVELAAFFQPNHQPSVTTRPALQQYLFLTLPLSTVSVHLQINKQTYVSLYL